MSPEESYADDVYASWVSDHYTGLSEDFLSALPPEEQPLDDDMTDRLDSDDFHDYCRCRFKIEYRQ